MSGWRLKEQDDLIELIRRSIHDEEAEVGPADKPFAVTTAFAKVEELLAEHMASPEGSQLRKMCPSMGRIFHRLDLQQALAEYDAATGLTHRRFVPPSFRECRQVLNLACVRAIAPSLKLVTLDADDTVYEDGGSLKVDSPMIPLICKLLRLGLHVSFVTAASYPGEPHKYELRLAGLLSSLAFAVECGAPVDLVSRFMVMGGQSNFLLRAKVDMPRDGLSPRVYLQEVPPDEWKDFRGVRWDHQDIKQLLDTAEACLRDTAAALQLDVLVIRKERAVGIVARSPATAGRLTYEVLEECALAVQDTLARAHAEGRWASDVPHCAFNGGHDVFVDIGHKALGIRALQGLLGIRPEETVHAGDRFTRSGNDLRAREVANTLWVASPSETEYLLTLLVADIRSHRDAGSAKWLPTTHVIDTAAAAAASATTAAQPVIYSPASSAASTSTAAAAPSPSPSNGPLPPGLNKMPTPSWHGALAAAAATGGLGHDQDALPPLDIGPSTAAAASATAPPAASGDGVPGAVPALAATSADGPTSLARGRFAPQLTVLTPVEPGMLQVDSAASVFATSPSATSAGGSGSGGGSGGAGAGAGAAAPAPGSARGRGISTAGGVVPDGYGLTAARAARESETRALTAMRSAWESAGGVVVGEVRGSAGGSNSGRPVVPASPVATTTPQQQNKAAAPE